MKTKRINAAGRARLRFSVASLLLCMVVASFGFYLLVALGVWGLLDLALATLALSFGGVFLLPSLAAAVVLWDGLIESLGQRPNGRVQRLGDDPRDRL
ncbi:MAG: hypothetical protein AAGA92_03215 [Planctomycetota bacterium]